MKENCERKCSLAAYFICTISFAVSCKNDRTDTKIPLRPTVDEDNYLHCRKVRCLQSPIRRGIPRRLAPCFSGKREAPNSSSN